MTAKVWVTQEQPGFDFTPAEGFGEVNFLTNNDLTNNKKSLHNTALIAALRHKLRQFNPDWDWVVIAGSPYVAAVVFMILAIHGHREIRVLRWQNRDHQYIPMYIDVREAFLNKETIDG